MKTCDCAPNNPAAIAPNPDPARWYVLEEYRCVTSYAIKLRYLDATNFEGVKILVYRGKFAILETRDPHFCESDETLVARFRPTPEGWELAKELVRQLSADCKQVLTFLGRVDVLLIDPPYGIDESSKKMDGFRAYYGYEEINDLNEWCFTVNERGEEPLKISYRALANSSGESMFDVEKIFLKGLATWINQKVNSQSMKATMEQLLAKSQS